MIGVFDSGIGGLIVAKAITEAFPNEPLIYLGDTARVPYGNKSTASIIEYSAQGVDFLVKNGADVIVIGCNTSSAVALPTLRKQCSVPILGVIDPAVDAALLATKNQRIGVIGTRATISSRIYREKLILNNTSVQVFDEAAPLLVPLIEEGWVSAPETKSILKAYLAPLLDRGIDTLILGCTHYPALEVQIAEIAGPSVTLISSAVVIVEPLKKLLRADTMVSRVNHGDSKQQPSRLYVTDRTPFSVAIAREWLGEDIELQLTHL